MSIQNKALSNGDFLLVSKLRLKTTPICALEKQTHLVRKQTRFILMLPVAGAVCMYVCMYVWYACMYVCMYMYACVYMYVCMYVCMYKNLPYGASFSNGQQYDPKDLWPITVLYIPLM